MQHDAGALAFELHVGDRARREQRLGVRVGGIAEDAVDVAELDDPAEVHHSDLVGDVLDHGEVVRHEQVREAELLLQADDEVEDLRLHRDVERRHGLVEDEHRGLEGEGTGDADALALATGELVGVAVRHLRVEPDELHQLAHPLASPAPCSCRGGR